MNTSTTVDLGRLQKNPFVLDENLDANNSNDLFRFNTGKIGNINIALNNISENDDADIQLFLDDGDRVFEPTSGDTLISSGPRPGNQDDSINVANQATGIYFLDVSRFDLGSFDDVDYRLSLSTSSPSNLLLSETSIGNLATDQVFNGNVSNSDTSDIFTFSLDSFEGVNVNLAPSGGNTNIRLTSDSNADGIINSTEILLESKAKGQLTDTIRVDKAGDYQLQVYQADNRSIQYTAIFDYFTTSAGSNSLGNLNDTPVLQNGTLTSTEPNDVFVFNTTSTGNINLALTDISADDNANLRLFRDDGDKVFEPTSDDVFISTAARRTNVDDSINVSGQIADTYFAEVRRSELDSLGDASYNLSLSTADPSNLLLNEIPLGNLADDLSINANVNNGDTSDLFVFSLDSSENANIILEPIDGNADIRLISDSNANGTIDAVEVLSDSTASGTRTDIIEVDDAGDYFLQVYQVSGDPINYNLSFDV